MKPLTTMAMGAVILALGDDRRDLRQDQRELALDERSR